MFIGIILRIFRYIHAIVCPYYSLEMNSNKQKRRGPTSTVVVLEIREAGCRSPPGTAQMAACFGSLASGAFDVPSTSSSKQSSTDAKARPKTGEPGARRPEVPGEGDPSARTVSGNRKPDGEGCEDGAHGSVAQIVATLRETLELLEQRKHDATLKQKVFVVKEQRTQRQKLVVLQSVGLSSASEEQPTGKMTRDSSETADEMQPLEEEILPDVMGSLETQVGSGSWKDSDIGFDPESSKVITFPDARERILEGELNILENRRSVTESDEQRSEDGGRFEFSADRGREESSEDVVGRASVRTEEALPGNAHKDSQTRGFVDPFEKCSEEEQIKLLRKQGAILEYNTSGEDQNGSPGGDIEEVQEEMIQRKEIDELSEALPTIEEEAENNPKLRPGRERNSPITQHSDSEEGTEEERENSPGVVKVLTEGTAEKEDSEEECSCSVSQDISADQEEAQNIGEEQQKVDVEHTSEEQAAENSGDTHNEVTESRAEKVDAPEEKSASDGLEPRSEDEKSTENVLEERVTTLNTEDSGDNDDNLCHSTAETEDDPEKKSPPDPEQTLQDKENVQIQEEIIEPLCDSKPGGTLPAAGQVQDNDLELCREKETDQENVSGEKQVILDDEGGNSGQESTPELDSEKKAFSAEQNVINSEELRNKDSEDNETRKEDENDPEYNNHPDKPAPVLQNEENVLKTSGEQVALLQEEESRDRGGDITGSTAVNTDDPDKKSSSDTSEQIPKGEERGENISDTENTKNNDEKLYEAMAEGGEDSGNKNPSDAEQTENVQNIEQIQEEFSESQRVGKPSGREEEGDSGLCPEQEDQERFSEEKEAKSDVETTKENENDPENRTQSPRDEDDTQRTPEEQVLVSTDNSGDNHDEITEPATENLDAPEKKHSSDTPVQSEEQVTMVDAEDSADKHNDITEYTAEKLDAPEKKSASGEADQKTEERATTLDAKDSGNKDDKLRGSPAESEDEPGKKNLSDSEQPLQINQNVYIVVQVQEKIIDPQPAGKPDERLPEEDDPESCPGKERDQKMFSEEKEVNLDTEGSKQDSDLPKNEVDLECPGSDEHLFEEVKEAVSGDNCPQDVQVSGSSYQTDGVVDENVVKPRILEELKTVQPQSFSVAIESEWTIREDEEIKQIISTSNVGASSSDGRQGTEKAAGGRERINMFLKSPVNLLIEEEREVMQDPEFSIAPGERPCEAKSQDSEATALVTEPDEGEKENLSQGPQTDPERGYECRQQDSTKEQGLDEVPDDVADAKRFPDIPEIIALSKPAVKLREKEETSQEPTVACEMRRDIPEIIALTKPAVKLKEQEVSKKQADQNTRQEPEGQGTSKESKEHNAQERSGGKDIKEEQKERDTGEESKGQDIKEEQKEQDTGEESKGQDIKEEQKEQDTGEESKGQDIKEEQKERDTGEESKGQDIKEEQKEQDTGEESQV